VARNKEKLRDELKKRTEVWRNVLRDKDNVGVARAVIRKIIGPLELWEGPVPEVPDYLQKYVEDPHWSQVPGAIPEPGDPGPKPRKVGFSAKAKPDGVLDGLVPPSSPTEG
jgi:hypothetical protein